MATLDEILAAMPDAPAGGTHELLIIDPDTRQIEVPEVESIFGVIRDGNAEKKYFQCPRYVGKGIDLAACKLRIAYQNASGTEEGRDGYLVQDLTESGGYVYFNWELSPKVCLYNGEVQFAVCAMLGDTVAWHTTLAKGTVLDGMEYTGEIVQTEMQDVIAQLLALVEAQSAAVEAVGATQVQTVEDAAKAAQEAALAEIEAKKQNALAEIPADYTAMGNQVDKLTRSTAGAIVCEAEGVAIQVADASDNYLPGLRIFGKSTQDGTPSPEAPVEIVSTAAPVVRAAGKNLLPLPYKDGTTKTHGGLTYTVQDDGSIYVTGTVTAAESYFVLSDFDFGEKSVGMGKSNGVYFWSDCLYNMSRHYTMLYFSQGNEVDRVYYPQVELGTAATEYESPAGQTLPITTPGSLPGIPVTSGGNYTDAEGQAWICDEVDLGRGVHVQRCFSETVKFELQADLNRYSAILSHEANAKCADGVGIPVMCHTLHFDPNCGAGVPVANGIRVAATSPKYAIAYYNGEVIESATIMYPLAEPIETPLSEAEMAAFAALRSVKPTTTILNDSGAHMAVEYVADTKLYIVRKLAELVAAMNA